MDEAQTQHGSEEMSTAQALEALAAQHMHHHSPHTSRDASEEPLPPYGPPPSMGDPAQHNDHSHYASPDPERVEGSHSQVPDETELREFDNQLREQVEEQLLQHANGQQQQQQRQAYPSSIATDEEVLLLRQSLAKIMRVLNEEGGMAGDQAGMLARIRELAAGATQALPFPTAPQSDQHPPVALPPQPVARDESTVSPAAADAEASLSQPQLPSDEEHQRFQQLFYPPGPLPSQMYELAIANHNQHSPSSGAGGAFPLLVAAAVAAQPAPVQTGPTLTTVPDAPVRKRKRKAAKVYPCHFEGCGRQFTRHFNLASHLKTHEETREKPYNCEACGKGFTRKVDRDRHANVHTKEKAHPCSTCSKAFTRKDALLRHITAHRCGSRPTADTAFDDLTAPTLPTVSNSPPPAGPGLPSDLPAPPPTDNLQWVLGGALVSSDSSTPIGTLPNSPIPGQHESPTVDDEELERHAEAASDAAHAMLAYQQGGATSATPTVNLQGSTANPEAAMLAIQELQRLQSLQSTLPMDPPSRTLRSQSSLLPDHFMQTTGSAQAAAEAAIAAVSQGFS